MATVHPSHRKRSIAKKFAAPLLHSSLSTAWAQVRIVEGRSGALMTVRGVSARLGVSTATVYKLCHSGELAHVRVSNAIRIAPDAVARYLTRAASAG